MFSVPSVVIGVIYRCSHFQFETDSISVQCNNAVRLNVRFFFFADDAAIDKGENKDFSTRFKQWKNDEGWGPISSYRLC